MSEIIIEPKMKSFQIKEIIKKSKGYKIIVKKIFPTHPKSSPLRGDDLGWVGNFLIFKLLIKII